MTSKEALNQLYILADVPELAMDIQSYYNSVEKDLEVVEILRKMFKSDLFIYLRNEIGNNFEYTGKQIYCIAKTFNGDDLTFNNQQDILKLKEWLNDK